MKKWVLKFRNKYVWTTALTLVYILFIHDTDIFALHSRRERVSELHEKINQKKEDIKVLKLSISNLDDVRAVEKYAREKHLFKKPNEDIYILSYR